MHFMRMYTASSVPQHAYNVITCMGPLSHPAFFNSLHILGVATIAIYALAIGDKVNKTG